MNRSSKGDKGTYADLKDGGGFVGIPWAVIDSPAYQQLSHPSKALLVEMARQLRGHNNGALLCSREFMARRGWSWDVVHRAKTNLLAAGFLHETVKGHRPNKASWYAVTWRSLDKLDGFDAGAAETFRKGAFRALQIAKSKPTRDELFQKWAQQEKDSA